MPAPPPDPHASGWTRFGPFPAPPNAGVCSWCGRRQSAELLVVMSGDGGAGICEDCVQAHSRFFAGRRARNVRR